jgi:exonuclease SbcC
MYITKIQVHNYLGLEHVKVEKVGKLLRITGENGVGKSSLLAAVREAFKGSGVDPDLVMTGTDKGSITINLDDDTVIKRMLSATSNTVDVRKNGKTVAKPATYLAALVGAINMNPVEFFNADERTQRAMLLQAIPCTLDRQVVVDLATEFDTIDPAFFQLDGIDYSQHGLNNLRMIGDVVYEYRRRVGQEVTQLEKSIAQDTQDLPEGVDNKRWADYDLDNAMSVLAAAERDQTEHEQQLVERDRLRTEYHTMQAELAALHKRIDTNIQSGKDLAPAIHNYKPVDQSTLRAEAQGYKQHLQHQATLDGIDRKRKEYDQIKAKHEQFDRLYSKVHTELPAALLATVELPIEGLVITEDGMTVNGRPLAKLSSAERVVFATNLARSLAGELKVICIDGYESLRGKLRVLFEKAMADDGMAYFIAEATDGPLRVDGQDPTDKGVKRELI